VTSHLGLDLGGTNIKWVVLDQDGTPIADGSLPTEADCGPDHVIERLLFEAPQKSQQAWFIRQFGPEVNLGNIPPDEVIPLETLRLGLRSDTMSATSVRLGVPSRTPADATPTVKPRTSFVTATGGAPRAPSSRDSRTAR